jgi:hypothetical protein
MDFNQFVWGCLGAALPELLHWRRISKRGRFPQYGRSPLYWVMTATLLLAGGAVAAGISPNGSSPVQLLLLGVAGPQLLLTASQTLTLKKQESTGTNPDKKNSLYLGSHLSTITTFLSE